MASFDIMTWWIKSKYPMQYQYFLYWLQIEEWPRFKSKRWRHPYAQWTWKNKFLFQKQQSFTKQWWQNVASVKKCNTYYPKVLPSKWIGHFSFSFYCFIVSKLKNEINHFKLDPISNICLMIKLGIENHYSK